MQLRRREAGWRAAGGEQSVRSKANLFRPNDVTSRRPKCEVQSSMDCTPVILGLSGLTRLCRDSMLHACHAERAWVNKSDGRTHVVFEDGMIGR